MEHELLAARRSVCQSISEDPWGQYDHHNDAHLFCEALLAYGCDHASCTQTYPEMPGLPPGPVVHLPMLDQQLSREALRQGTQQTQGAQGAKGAQARVKGGLKGKGKGSFSKGKGRETRERHEASAPRPSVRLETVDLLDLESETSQPVKKDGLDGGEQKSMPATKGIPATIRQQTILPEGLGPEVILQPGDELLDAFAEAAASGDPAAIKQARDAAKKGVVARWGRRRSAMRDSHLQRRSSIQRRSSKANTFRFREKEKPTEVKKPAPEIFTLQKLSSRHNIPFQVSEQAFSWWFQFAKPESFLGTREDVVDGMEFDIPSLGLMSHDTFVKACCAISDVDDPKLLDMEFVGSVLLRAAEYLESLDGHLDFAEFLTFFHKFSFSEEVLINRQERELRRLARKHGFSFLDIDALKKDFDKVDRKGEGKLKQDEFLELMARLMKLPPGQEIPSKKKKELWIAATRLAETIRHGRLFGFLCPF
eukprot:g128.t1